MSARIRWMLALYGPALALLAATAIGGLLGIVNISNLMLDLARIANVHPLTGAVSFIGILMWNWAAAVSLFAAGVLFSRGRRRAGAFLLSFGLFSLVLGIDDLFLVHEDLAERYLGLDEKPVLAFYAATAALLLLRFRTDISRTDTTLLILALVFFGGSIVEDQLRMVPGIWHTLVEDGSKLLGITGWMGYLFQTSYRLVVQGACLPAGPLDERAALQTARTAR